MKPNIIRVLRRLSPVSSALPSFLSLGQRHFEKEKPSGISEGSGIRYTLPVDLLTLVLPEGADEQIESIEVVYQKRGA